MKLQICAEIEGLFLLKEKVTAKLYPYEFVLFQNNDKRYISVTKPVKNYMEFAPKMFVKNGVVNIEATKPELYKDLEDWLYYIEAMGAFNFEVSKTHFDELEVIWICENEEEKRLIPITSIKRTRQVRKAEKHVTNDNLFNLVFYRKKLPESYIPYTYYRQAKVFFDNNNYYFAFINYFMMLEFCFAEGNFRKREMTTKFKKSNLLKLCILASLTILKSNDKDENYKWLSYECKSKQKNLDFEGIVHLLVEYRGLLSHASERSKKYLFEDFKLRPLAFITGLICFWLCGYIQVYSCSNEEQRTTLMQKRIKELEIGLKEDGLTSF